MTLAHVEEPALATPDERTGPNKAPGSGQPTRHDHNHTQSSKPKILALPAGLPPATEEPLTEETTEQPARHDHTQSSKPKILALLPAGLPTATIEPLPKETSPGSGSPRNLPTAQHPNDDDPGVSSLSSPRPNATR